jgi:rhodanese-related sulfurtransferase
VRATMNSFKYSFFVFLLSAIFICSYAQVNREISITVEQLQNQMNTNENLIILDVRNPSELSGNLGHIEGIINIPVQQLSSRITELNEFKVKDFAVICRSGRRSVTATNLLLKNGFSAKNILGGMVQYRASEDQK